MKRVLSLLLCLALALSPALPVLAAEEPIPEAAIVDAAAPEEETPAASPADAGGEPEAEQGMDAALAELTLQVKQALDVDDDYADFTSDYYDGPSPRWSLYWSDDDRGLTVEVQPDGTVVNMYRWTNSGRNELFYGFDPTFPALTMEQASAQAEQWCGRLFTGEESARVDDIYISLGSEGYYRISGTVLKNGLESPVDFTMVIDGTGLSSFWRSGSESFVGQTPAVEQGDPDAAAQALAGAVELELRYVSDGEGAAHLRYVPVGPRTVVLADSGEAVDMDALYEGLSDGGARGYGAASDAVAEASAMSGGAYLTETESASIDNYGDVLDQTALDETLRRIDALGLEEFSLVRCSYAVDSQTGGVNASMRYTGTMTGERLYGYSDEAFDQAVDAGQDMTIYKYITVDAKTGALQSVSTDYPLWNRADEPGLDVQAELAVAFAEQVVPDLAAEAAGCTLKGYDERNDVVLAQVKDGYFYPDNRIEVHADPDSGVVDQFRYDWDEDVTFGPADDIVDADAALAAYTDALEVTLGYVAWPVDVLAEPDGPYADWLRWGYTYVEQLRLGYYYDGTDSVEGVDAATGEAVMAGERADAYTYDDLEDVPNAERIQTLGLAGVGLAGGKFQPDAELTVRDAALLLLRAGGVYAPEGDDGQLLEQAAYQGFLTRKGWQPEQTVSRIEFLRMLIGPSRYGYAAALSGIWDAGFADVDEADQAIAAIARALGLAEGDTLGPDETLTRAGAADILYRFMDR